jgi:membrane protein YqaA with SNARE-associated domain
MHVTLGSVEALNVLDPRSLLSSLGVLGVFLVLFAETGLLVGFFLPGDSLLFTAGLLCTTAATAPVHLSLPAVLIAAAIGALTGAQVGYWIGRRAGPGLLDRPDRPRLHAGVVRAREALDRYGNAKAIVLRPLHPGSPHRAEPARRHGRRAGAHLHRLAGRRRVGLVARCHRRRLRARLKDPQRRPLPAARHRRHRRRLVDPRGSGTTPHSRAYLMTAHHRAVSRPRTHPQTLGRT